jgi:hypothetical protein
MSSIYRDRTGYLPFAGENFLYVFKGARSAPGAGGRIDSPER